MGLSDVLPDRPLTTFIYEHNGDSNFIVEAFDAEADERIAIPINEIGTVSGAVALPASGLEFYVDIDADGDWSVIIAQPLAMSEDIRVPPVSASGTGDQVICPVELGGGETVAGTHSGSGNFIVEAIPDDAFETFEVELLFNELDSFDGETVATTEYVCWLDVMAGGGWSLDIE